MRFDAADADDSGTVNISDGIRILETLFASGGPLPEPAGACGVDPTDDGLNCDSYELCERRAATGSPPQSS